MKNIYLLIFLLIFLYFICNGYIENFSVGCQSNGQGNDNKINISGSLTLSNIPDCKPICKENHHTPNYTYWVLPNTCTCPENTRLQHSDNHKLTRCAPPSQCNTRTVFPTGQGCEWIDLNEGNYKKIHDCSKFVTTGKYLCENGTEPGRIGKGFCKNGVMCSGNFNCTNSCEFKNRGKQQCDNYKNICNCVNYQGGKYNCKWTSYW